MAWGSMLLRGHHLEPWLFRNAGASGPIALSLTCCAMWALVLLNQLLFRRVPFPSIHTSGRIDIALTLTCSAMQALVLLNQLLFGPAAPPGTPERAAGPQTTPGGSVVGSGAGACGSPGARDGVAGGAATAAAAAATPPGSPAAGSSSWQVASALRLAQAGAGVTRTASAAAALAPFLCSFDFGMEELPIRPAGEGPRPSPSHAAASSAPAHASASHTSALAASSGKEAAGKVQADGLLVVPPPGYGLGLAVSSALQQAMFVWCWLSKFD